MKYFKLYLPKLFQCKCDEGREGITMIGGDGIRKGRKTDVGEIQMTACLYVRMACSSP
jgi:hypothetical protein